MDFSHFDSGIHGLDGSDVADMRAAGAFLNLGGQSLASLQSAQSAINTLDIAIGNVSQTRGDLGAFQNRLGYNLRNSANSIENNQASESSIRDADVADEVSEFTKTQILVQASISMLSQANLIPQIALSLLL
jgi:flagellin